MQDGDVVASGEIANNTTNMHDNSEFKPEENTLSDADKRMMNDNKEVAPSIDAMAQQAAAFFDGEVKEPMAEAQGADFDKFADVLVAFKPTPIKENGPSFLKGFFKARIDSIRRYTGTDKNGNPYDMYSFAVETTGLGNKKSKGYAGKKLSETFSLIDGTYNDSAANFQKLLTFLFYAGIEINFANWDEFDGKCGELEGKPCFVDVKPKMKWLVEGPEGSKTFTKVLGDDGKQLFVERDGYIEHKWEIVPNIPNMLKDEEETAGPSLTAVPVF